MKKIRSFWRWTLPLALMMYSAFFPQSIFRGCVHVVFEEEQPAREDDLLTEEAYLDLFHIQTSEYKLTWKLYKMIVQND